MQFKWLPSWSNVIMHILWFLISYSRSCLYFDCCYHNDTISGFIDGYILFPYKQYKVYQHFWRFYLVCSFNINFMYSVYIHSNYSRLNSLNKHDFLSYGISSFLLHTSHRIPIKQYRIYQLWKFLIDGALHGITVYRYMHKDTIVAPSSKSAV